MKRTPLNKFSPKGLANKRAEDKLRKEYAADYSCCMTCGTIKWPGLALSHIIAKSRGGKTTRQNTLLECQTCHHLYEKKPETRPLWQQKRAGLI